MYPGQNVLTAQVKEPTLLPDIGLWHPLAPKVFETTQDYNTWFDNEHAKLIGINPATAPTIGIILQKSHINTKDEAHYTSLIQELEARG